ncbi:MAG: TIGR01212 family radical SAM protein [Erysipelotrichaceae bacterium]|nr:TIGR01212 family radical SAM protein [Erysipelotrichaceae bacterium]
MSLMTKEKPYNTLTAYYKNKYNAKVAKIALNAGFTCPNKDGKKGYGGCTYCSKLGSGDFAGNKEKSLKEQFNDIRAVMEKKWPNILYIPYLQANSNTYAPLNKLKEIYEEVISIIPEKTVAISIATRPDCLEDDVVEYLGKLNNKIPVQIELGLQTSNEKTANKINRCSTNEEFISAVKRLRRHNIEIVAHIINGLPYETKEDMLNTISFINNLDIQGIKIHSLLVLKDTKLHEEYKNEGFKILTLEEYVDITAEQIRMLKPSIIIHRLQADGVYNDLVEPKWSLKKLVVMNEIDKTLRKNKYFQGQKYKD